VGEERSQHDIEYPDIPSIPEEAEEDTLPSPRGSPVVFPEFDPDTSVGRPAPGGRHGAERREGGGEVELLAWQGVARKAAPSSPSIHMNMNTH